MFLQNSMASAPAAAADNPSKKAKTQDPQRHIENLDFRLRQLEGERICFFLNEQTTPSLVEKLRAAEAHYKSRAPAKGQPHPDLNKK